MLLFAEQIFVNDQILIIKHEDGNPHGGAMICEK